jgi:twitching motility protein PilT
MATAEIDELPPQTDSRREPEINKLFRAVMKFEASDLHLKVGLPAMMRLKGVIRRMDLPPISEEQMEKLIFPIMTPRLRKILEETGGADFAHVVGHDEQRFRVNVLRQRGHLGMVSRRVSNNVPTFQKLGLPPSIELLCKFDQGMIILAGVTGSGKSTTIASMLDYLNEREQLHILTIEDPIEYLFSDKKSVINQREVGIWWAKCATAIRSRLP